MNTLERYAVYGDVLAIFGFALAVYYFWQKPKRTLLENLLFLFVLAGLVVDTTLTVYRFGKVPPTNVPLSFATIVHTLYRQAARWAVASEQDENPIIALLHANYATGYLWALKDIVSTEEFYIITKTDFLSFEQKITAIQDKATQKVVIACRSVIPVSDPSLLKAIYYRAEEAIPSSPKQ